MHKTELIQIIGLHPGKNAQMIEAEVKIDSDNVFFVCMHNGLGPIQESMLYVLSASFIKYAVDHKQEKVSWKQFLHTHGVQGADKYFDNQNLIYIRREMLVRLNDHSLKEFSL